MGMRALPLDVSSAVDGVSLQRSAAASPHLATSQVITGQRATIAMWWGAQKSCDHSLVICWGSAPAATGIALRLAKHAQRRLKPPRRRGRVGEFTQPGGHPQLQQLTWIGDKQSDAWT